MLNAEKFKDGITAIMNKSDYFAIDIDNPNAVRHCGGFECKNCVLHNNDYNDCNFVRIKWLLSEYKEKIILSKFEYNILEKAHNRRFEYIIRNECGGLRAYRCKPYKEHFVWYPYDRDEMPYDLTLFDDLFAFVTFEDSEPTSIEYVLKNCEVVNDAEE